MNINDIKARIGEIKNLEIARANITKSEVLTKIVNYIKDQGLDVDDKYLEFVSNLDYSKVDVEVKFVPIYKVTSIARLSWKEKNKEGQPTDHEEFVRFNSVFYAHQNSKKERINKLCLLDSIDKDAMKVNETKMNTLLETSINNEITVIDEHKFIPQVILDETINGDDYYPLDNNLILSSNEIKILVQKDLEKTKSYKRLVKESEKWSRIEQMDISITLVPIANIHIGNHIQLVNTANGKIDIIYEKSKEITSKLIQARWICYPSVILFGLLSILILLLFIFTECGLPIFLMDKIWKPFTNFNGWIWLVCTIFGLFLTIFALPTRKGIVKRATNNKNTLSKCRRFSFILYGVDFGLIILLLTILQFIIFTSI